MLYVLFCSTYYILERNHAEFLKPCWLWQTQEQLTQEPPAQAPSASSTAVGASREDSVEDVDAGEPMELEHPGLLAEDRSDKKGTFKDRFILNLSRCFSLTCWIKVVPSSWESWPASPWTCRDCCTRPWSLRPGSKQDWWEKSLTGQAHMWFMFQITERDWNFS